MTRAVSGLLFAAALLGAPVAGAQSPDDGTSPETARGFLSRYAFHLSAAGISSGDPRFTAQVRFGGDVDVLDLGSGRLTLLADYEALEGNVIRLFEPLQGTYRVDAAATARARGVEVGPVFRHVSRHLSDQYQQYPVDWNELAARVLVRRTVAGWTTSSCTDVGGVLRKRFVDYTWMIDSTLHANRALRRGVTLFVEGAVNVVGVDGSVEGRGAQTGTRGETGVSLSGRAAALELFASWERRIDAWPLERQPSEWVVAGFRFAHQ